MNDMTIDQMLEKFKQFHQMYEERIREGKEIGMIIDEFESTDGISTDYSPSSRKILEFSKSIEKYSDTGDFNRMGIYLSVLANASPDNEIHFDISELKEKKILIDLIGYKLKNKKLTVQGDVGDMLALHAENSIIKVSGNAGENVGLYSQYCSIDVDGNSGKETGFEINRCKITINGNAPGIVGFNAKNSEISINGNTGTCLGFSSQNSQIKINGNAGDDIGISARNTKIHINGEIGRLGPIIGEGTEIYQMQNGIYVKVWPE